MVLVPAFSRPFEFLIAFRFLFGGGLPGGERSSLYPPEQLLELCGLKLILTRKIDDVATWLAVVLTDKIVGGQEWLTRSMSASDVKCRPC